MQTLWLLLASAAGFLTLQYPFFSGIKPDARQMTLLTDLNGTSHFLLLVLSVAVSVAALLCIFLYKDRRLQLRVSVITLLIAIGNLVFYFYLTGKFSNGHYALTALFAFLVPVFLILAIRGIYRDEKLVKEADRLR